jgi:hypothetical protein
MVKWYSILFVFIWVCIPEMTYPGIGPAGDRDGVQGAFAQHGKSAQGGKIFFVQYDTKKSAESTGKNDEKESKGKTFNKEKDDPQKRKQLKPFVPSETIPADQGVDFPYDI